jgi:AcrR family transcriptional regulator
MATRYVSSTRAAMRRDTEQRIVVAARSLFSTRGYSSTSIRAIADAAESDPALVIRYFGSKDQLFAHAAQLVVENIEARDEDHLVEELLAALAVKLQAPPTELLANLRSMLTHPDSASQVGQAMSAQQQSTAQLLRGDAAATRAGLVGAIMVGVVLGRYVLKLDGLADAEPDEILELLRPLVADLINPE